MIPDDSNLIAILGGDYGCKKGGFDPEKDKILKAWRSEETGLIVSINKYGEGEPKVQIGPRMIVKKDGKEVQSKAGRMTIEDLIWFYEIIDEVKDELSALAGPE